MAAPPKLAHGREARLLAQLTLGERLEATCCAILVSSTAARKRAHRDPAFAGRSKAVREQRAPAGGAGLARDRRAAGREHPEQWAFARPYCLHGVPGGVGWPRLSRRMRWTTATTR